MAQELSRDPEITITPRRVSITITEQQAQQLVERLKFGQTHLPDLTKTVWSGIEDNLGYRVNETPSL